MNSNQGRSGAAAPVTTPRRFLAGYLNEEELAAEFRRSIQTLRRWRRQRKGPPYVTDPGGEPLYPIDEGREWLRNNLVQPRVAKAS